MCSKQGASMKLAPKDLLIGIAVTVLWGCNFSMIEWGLQSMDPFLLTLLRFVFCAVPAVFFIAKPKDVSYVTLALYGSVFGAGLWWVVNFAMFNGLSPGMSSVFLQFSAFFTIIVSSIFLKERINSLHFSGMLFSAIGLVMILTLSESRSTAIGILLVLAAALAWSFCNLLVKVKNRLTCLLLLCGPVCSQSRRYSC
jgi:O-acetylserine/cysteine efflux transporter